MIVDHDGGDEDEVHPDDPPDTRGTLAAASRIREEFTHNPYRDSDAAGRRYDAVQRLYRAALAEQAAHRRSP